MRSFPTLASAEAWGAEFGHSKTSIDGLYAGNQDFQGQLFGNNKASYESDISVSGTQGGTQYFVSGLAKYDNGIMNNTGYNKQSVRSNITQQVGGNLTLSANLFYAHSVTVRGISGNDNYGISPYDVFSYTPQFLRQNKALPDGTWPINPYGPANAFADAALIQTPEAVNRFIGGGNINWTPWKTEHQSIQLNVIGGADYSDLRDNLYAPPYLQVEQLASPLHGISDDPERQQPVSQLLDQPHPPLHRSVRVRLHDVGGLRTGETRSVESVHRVAEPAHRHDLTGDRDGADELLQPDGPT